MRPLQAVLQMSWLLLLFAPTALANLYQCAGNRTPPKDETCYTATADRHVVMYYGRKLWYHAMHTTESRMGNRWFPVLTDSEEHDANRDKAMRGLDYPSKYGRPGTVRDEKPLAGLKHDDHISVMLLPDSESRKEGTFSRQALSAASPKGFVRLLDNRADPEDPPYGFAPEYLKIPSQSPQPPSRSSQRSRSHSPRDIDLRILRRALDHIEDLLAEKEMMLSKRDVDNAGPYYVEREAGTDFYGEQFVSDTLMRRDMLFESEFRPDVYAW